MIIDNTTPISKTPADPAVRKLLEDLQGNILKSHAKPNVRLLFIQFTGPVENVKNWIRSLPVTSMQEQLDDHKAFKTERVMEKELQFCSISFTQTGYNFLDVQTESLADQSFLSGMGTGTIPNDPPKNQWENKYQQPIYALLILAHNTPSDLDAFVAQLTASINNIARVLAQETGRALPGEKEHFGFADGISQPRYFEEDMTSEGTTQNWDPFASLNLALVKDPGGRAFNSGITGNDDFPVDDFSGNHSYGSYLVFRKLEQDVARWNNAVGQLASNLSLSPDSIGAFTVGRFQDGTPVVNHAKPQGQMPHENDFNYGIDPSASKCPFHAHIRKANPRGDSTQLGATLEQEKRHRITRRGIPYVDDGNKKGLLFMCYQSSIESQFDFMQNAWVDNENFVKPGTGIDDVIGQGTSTDKSWPSSHGGAPAAKTFSFDGFVKMKGGEYFFTPSISFLRTI